jgi:hypothetical protein
MSETPYVETDAHAGRRNVRPDVDDLALRLVDGDDDARGTGGCAARAVCGRVGDFLLDDEGNRCEGCGEPVRPAEGISVGLGARTIWCRP